MIRVLLVDDHTLVRVGLQRILERSDEIEVAAVANRGDEAMALDAELRPDVILMDISMPGLSGIETTRQICTRRPEALVVMLTAITDRAMVLDALDAGAVGYLVKDADPVVLVDGIRAAANGDSPLDPRAAKALHDNRVAQSPTLTEREAEDQREDGEGLPHQGLRRAWCRRPDPGRPVE